MSKKPKKVIRALTGRFVGWGDDILPHRYIKLATIHGEQVIKVAKSIRHQIQDWQPGNWLTLMCQERTDGDTGDRYLKVKQLLPITSAVADSSAIVSARNLSSTKIQICQGSSCRRKGSDRICRSIQAYLVDNNLTDRVEIEPIKCLHQCKAAPQAIFVSSEGATLPGKMHYRQLQADRLPTILAKHFPILSIPKPLVASIIDKIDNYLDLDRIAYLTTS
jgi:(2Fe-2S) ferredoxin